MKISKFRENSINSFIVNNSNDWDLNPGEWYIWIANTCNEIQNNEPNVSVLSGECVATKDFPTSDTPVGTMDGINCFCRIKEVRMPTTSAPNTNDFIPTNLNWLHTGGGNHRFIPYDDWLEAITKEWEEIVDGANQGDYTLEGIDHPSSVEQLQQIAIETAANRCARLWITDMFYGARNYYHPE